MLITVIQRFQRHASKKCPKIWANRKKEREREEKKERKKEQVNERKDDRPRKKGEPVSYRISRTDSSFAIVDLYPILHIVVLRLQSIFICTYLVENGNKQRSKFGNIENLFSQQKRKTKILLALGLSRMTGCDT